MPDVHDWIHACIPESSRQNPNKARILSGLSMVCLPVNEVTEQ